ncbi:MAG: hypothetical protein KBC56_04955 [Flavobacterium sp.]|nr:hypothetical protein [Flavobacterium sp.]
MKTKSLILAVTSILFLTISCTTDDSYMPENSPKVQLSKDVPEENIFLRDSLEAGEPSNPKPRG